MLNPPTSRIAGFDARPVHPFWTEAARASRRRAPAANRSRQIAATSTAAGW